MEIISLRFLHIFAGIFWAGGLMFMAFFFIPLVKKLGPDGGKVMGQLGKTRGFATVMSILALITIICGLRLLWLDSGKWLSNADGMNPWYMEGMGLYLTLGGIIAIIAFLIGFFFNRPAVGKIGKISAEVTASGNPPSGPQLEELAKLRARVFSLTGVIASMLAVTVVLMAVARYIH